VTLPVASSNSIADDNLRTVRDFAAGNTTEFANEGIRGNNVLPVTLERKAELLY